MFGVQQIRDGYYSVPSRSRCARLFQFIFMDSIRLGRLYTFTYCIKRAAQWHRHRLIKLNASDLRKAKKNKFLLKIESFLIGGDCDRFLSLGCAFVSCEILYLQNLFSFSPAQTNWTSFTFLISQKILRFCSPATFLIWIFSFWICRRAYCREPHFISFYNFIFHRK